MIAAASENEVIGVSEKNDMPWGKIKADMNRFQKLTMGHPCIMGRKTKESLKGYRLKGRKEIVLSRNLEVSEEVYVARSMDEALNLAEDYDFATKEKEAYIIGGAEVYEMFLPHINKIELTRLHRNYDGDVLLPEINWEEWNQVYREDRETSKGLGFSFETYVRE